MVSYEHGPQLPTLKLEFIGDSGDNFTLEELTFNPYLANQTWLTPASAELWIEFCIRNDSPSGDATVREVPAITFRFTDESGRLLEPSVIAATTKSHGDLDLNELMYSELWYSFVAPDGKFNEFMSRGYKRPQRVVDDTMLKTTSLFWEGSLSDRLVADISDGPIAKIAARIASKVEAFSTFVNDFPLKKSWECISGAAVANDTSGPLFRIPGDHVIASVPIEYSESSLRGRFACRREPWVRNEQRSGAHWGIGYGGTAKIERRPAHHLLSPMLITGPGRTERASLGRSESIRFWVRIATEAGVTQESRSQRISVAYEISSGPKLESFNSFFRVPRDFKVVEGTLTDVRRYTVPPKLFEIWDEYLPDQCYSFNVAPNTAHERIYLNVDIQSQKAETDKLLTVFVVGLLASLLIATGRDSYFTEQTLIAGTPPARLLFASAMSTLYLVVVAWSAYCGRRTNLLIVFLASVFPLSITIAYHLLFCDRESSFLEVALVLLVWGSLAGASLFWSHAIWAIRRYREKFVKMYSKRRRRKLAYAWLREER
jgi:hypothetical protein